MLVFRDVIPSNISLTHLRFKEYGLAKFQLILEIELGKTYEWRNGKN